MASHFAVSLCAAVERRRSSTSDFTQSCHQVMSQFNLFSSINILPKKNPTMLTSCSIATAQYSHKLHTCGESRKDNMVYPKESQEEAVMYRYVIKQHPPLQALF